MIIIMVVMYNCKYFCIQELVSKVVYDKYGDFCWRFFSDPFKQDLDIIREYLDETLIINDWYFGGNHFTQCGFRSNLDPIVRNKETLYCSAHCMGKAIDLHSYNNKKLWEVCRLLIEDGTLQAVKRLESQEGTQNGWVHIDCLETPDGKLEIF